jgi:O-antigen/teichoic acid export membrane protein
MSAGSPSAGEGRRQAVLRYVSSTAVMGAGLIAHTIGLILVARALGPQQFGQLAIITAVSNFGLAFCGLGGSEALRRAVSRDPECYPHALGHALILVGTTSVVLSIALSLGLALALEASPRPGENFAIMLLFVASNLALFAWIGLTEQILLARDDLARANFVNISSGLGRAAAAVLACLVFGVADLKQWALWHFGFYAVVALICLAAVWRYGRPQLRLLPGELGKGWTLSVTSLLMIARQNADVMALAAVASPATIGIYSVARRIVSTASVVSASLDRLVYGNLARAGKEGVSATLALALRYARISGAMCIAASLALYLAAPLVPYVFGQQYAEAVALLRLLCWSLVLTGLHYLAFDALNAADQHQQRLAAEVASGLIGLVVLGALTVLGGLGGIICASYLASALVVVALWATLFRLAKDRAAGGAQVRAAS